MTPGLPGEVRAWGTLAGVCARYLAHRAGLGARPTLTTHFHECMVVFGRVLGWPDRIVIRGAEKCPRGPAVFCENHICKDDPFVTGAAAQLANGETWLHYMMRDDFFPDRKWLGVIDPNDLVEMMGTHLISRDKVTLPQLKVFVTLLREGQPFLMFPGRTRSRSGLFMEYRDDVQEPGGPSWFVAQVQRSDPAARIPVVPVARTFNPVSKRTAVAFGTPLFLEAGAGRDAQRVLDYAVIDAMAALVEVNAVHLLSGLLYLQCLHGMTAPRPAGELAEAVARVAGALDARLLDPSLTDRCGEQVRATLAWLAGAGMVRLEGDRVAPVREAVLNLPEMTKGFREANPVRFHVNQVLHLGDVTAALEAEVLGQPLQAPSA
jgi:hypothetical protein